MASANAASVANTEELLCSVASVENQSIFVKHALGNKASSRYTEGFIKSMA